MKLLLVAACILAFSTHAPAHAEDQNENAFQELLEEGGADNACVNSCVRKSAECNEPGPNGKNPKLSAVRACCVRNCSGQ